MLGKSHALSGAVGWLAGCALLTELGQRPPGLVIGVGAAVSTGFALLPDIDHPGSTVARTLGPITRIVSKVVAFTSSRTRRASCGHCAGHDGGGHRGLTHTAAGATLTGLIIAALGWKFGQAVGLAVVGFAVWLAAHTALSSKTRAKIGDWLLPGKFRRLGPGAFRFTAGVGAVTVAVLFVGSISEHAARVGWWWIGVPVAWGCLAHTLGDAMTLSRVPLWWPIEIRGCRWRNVGTPRWMRFRTGSRVETAVVVLMACGGFGAMYVLGHA